MPHNAEKRREATVQPVVLFGLYGRTVEGYRPESDALFGARNAKPLNNWVPVEGPHLRVARARDRRNKTGIVGISISRRSDGTRWVYVNLGKSNRCFSITKHGQSEAMRRAIVLRREHLIQLALANAAILAARAKGDAR